MEIRKNSSVDPVHQRKLFDEIAELDAICFDYNDFEAIQGAPETWGHIYALTVDEVITGYTVYGQTWINEGNPDAYILRIGIHPNYRRQGWAVEILKAIVSDLSARTDPECSAVYADIRKSNIVSQQLFKKAGFQVYCERDGIYPDDETSVCVRKILSPISKY